MASPRQVARYNGYHNHSSCVSSSEIIATIQVVGLDVLQSFSGQITWLAAATVPSSNPTIYSKQAAMTSEALVQCHEVSAVSYPNLCED